MEFSFEFSFEDKVLVTAYGTIQEDKGSYDSEGYSDLEIEHVEASEPDPVHERYVSIYKDAIIRKAWGHADWLQPWA